MAKLVVGRFDYIVQTNRLLDALREDGFPLAGANPPVVRAAKDAASRVRSCHGECGTRGRTRGMPLAPHLRESVLGSRDADQTGAARFMRPTGSEMCNSLSERFNASSDTLLRAADGRRSPLHGFTLAHAALVVLVALADVTSSAAQTAP